VDNDGDGRIDYDAGLSANGVADPAGADPQCADSPWRNDERASRSCGLGFELGLVLLVLAGLARRRRLAR
jgi:hypothetical protein